jgi:hypothetical protein
VFADANFTVLAESQGFDFAGHQARLVHALLAHLLNGQTSEAQAGPHSPRETMAFGTCVLALIAVEAAIKLADPH